MKASGKGLTSPERRDRRARVSASVAYHLVELLNEWKDGQYYTVGEIPSECGITAQYHCTDCHGDKIPPIPQSINLDTGHRYWYIIVSDCSH